MLVKPYAQAIHVNVLAIAESRPVTSDRALSIIQRNKYTGRPIKTQNTLDLDRQGHRPIYDN